MNTLLIYADTIKSQPRTNEEINGYRESVDSLFRDFGAWQRQSVEALVHDISESARNLIGTVSSAIEGGDETVNLLKDLSTGLDEAKGLDDINAIRTILRVQIEATKQLIVKQSEQQKALTQAQDKEMGQLEERLVSAESASHTDYLTQLANRAAFDYYASAMIQKVKFGEAAVSIAILDLDQFKGINDTHGHLAGDSALNEFAGLLRRFLGNQAFLARYGGDEFVVAWSGTAQDLKNKLNALIRFTSTRKTKINVGNNSTVLLNLGFSAGVTEVKVNDSLKDAIERGDKALYESKRTGRGKVTTEVQKAA